MPCQPNFAAVFVGFVVPRLTPLGTIGDRHFAVLDLLSYGVVPAYQPKSDVTVDCSQIPAAAPCGKNFGRVPGKLLGPSLIIFLWACSRRSDFPDEA